ncbi:30S ribosomal protein S19 [archaeon]|jgi:small subunit ribosomal protein S19|nr:30S ribosomal protein S19 [archaeon]MBT3450725.1 30S ribosomal protein S19 [archaeon]MBT6869217.1 30S ribosomal protein S19 [archaeon]MBT7193753.1 30S ribosomal protein S19 [archaeon]MBT7381400.1 30S ribosomal protein S19 [archaeon]
MAKEIKWRGMSEEEVKSLDFNKFLELIPSQRRRSLKRGFTKDQEALLKKLKKNEKNIKTHSRGMIILPEMLGHVIQIHNGKGYIKITITLEMMAHTLGEFAPSRKMVSHSSAGVGATRSSKAVTAR